jgi:hypothetical protein
MDFEQLFETYFNAFVSKEVPHMLAKFVAEVLADRDINGVEPSDEDYLSIAQVQRIVGARAMLPAA